MLRKRIIVCLDVRRGRAVKGVRFQGLRDVGDPAELAGRYEAEGADEIVFLDVSAALEGRRTLLDAVRRTAERLFIPLTVGGGVRELQDVDALLRAGADKVSVNTAALERPQLVQEMARRFGSQCVVVSIDARVPRGAGSGTAVERSIRASPDGSGPDDYAVFTHGGSRPSGRGALGWARQCVELGAGEILLTSIDRDGCRDGYDLELTGRVAERVTVPVIASGGAGAAYHMRDAFTVAGADAALAAGIFHDQVTTVTEVKRQLATAGVLVRLDSGMIGAEAKA
ncbi:MAG: imidazole glycerol phosphate synthase subunit HisF [Longimicrobiales bacterium]